MVLKEKAFPTPGNKDKALGYKYSFSPLTGLICILAGFFLTSRPKSAQIMGSACTKAIYAPQPTTAERCLSATGIDFRGGHYGF